MDQLARARAQRLVAHVRPQAFEVGEVRGELLRGCALGGGAHDVAARMPLAHDRAERVAQARALGFRLDARRDAEPLAARHEHQETRRQRDEGREPRALAADRVLQHLHDDVVAGIDEPADVRRRRNAARPGGRRLAVAGDHALRVDRDVRGGDVVDVQERGALEAGVDERRLHARQHARHAPLVDVADDAAAAGALDEDLVQHAVLEQRRARFARADVDQDLGRHATSLGRAGVERAPAAAAGGGRAASYSAAVPGGAPSQGTSPARASSAAVSNSGRPTTPE